MTVGLCGAQSKTHIIIERLECISLYPDTEGGGAPVFCKNLYTAQLA